MASLGTVGILCHDMFEEGCDIVEAGVLGVADVLPIIVTGFE